MLRISRNTSGAIDSILAFYRREEQKISDSQRLLETVGGFMGRPARNSAGTDGRYGFVPTQPVLDTLVR
jgi:hypothetical protein